MLLRCLCFGLQVLRGSNCLCYGNCLNVSDGVDPTQGERVAFACHLSGLHLRTCYVPLQAIACCSPNVSAWDCVDPPMGTRVVNVATSMFLACCSVEVLQAARHALADGPISCVACGTAAYGLQGLQIQVTYGRYGWCCSCVSGHLQLTK